MLSSFKISIYFTIISTVFSSPAWSDTDDDDLSNLLSLLNKQTSLATNSHLNKDFVPGMVSIMSGDDMQSKGFSDLWEVMAVMPGVQQSIDSSGMKTLIVRGVSQTIGSAKIKWLLNGVVLNSSSTSTVGTILNTPVSQIERVEFIRGPGSAIHGEFALAGVVNVITKKSDELLSYTIASNNTHSINAAFKLSSSNDLFQGSINIAAFDTDGENIQTGMDKTPQGINGYAPGHSNNKLDNTSVIIDLNYANTNLLMQFQQSNRGEHFGVDDYLSPSSKQTVISDSVTTLELNKDVVVSKNIDAHLAFTYLKNSTEKNKLFKGVAPIFGGLASEDDIVSFVDLSEERLTTLVSLSYQYDHHKFYNELSYTDLKVKNYQQSINVDPITKLPTTSLNDVLPPVSPGTSRSIVSFVFQDEWEYNDEITITLGARYDAYDDIKNNLSPRVATVWRLSPSEIIKFQYSEAFRPPTLLELNGAISGLIRPETSHTTEFSYILLGDDSSIRSTFYSTKIFDLIAFQNQLPFGYNNFGEATIIGLEVELDRTITSNLLSSSTLTLQQSHKGSDALKLYELVPWFINTNLAYQYSDKTSLNLLLKHRSKIGRHKSDIRADLASQTQLDLSINKSQVLAYKNLSSNIVIKNIFNEKIKSPAQGNTYLNDYTFDQSASFWLTLTYKFF